MIPEGSTLEIDNSEWKYIGEGAAHIVFSYCGKRDELLGMALRIPKIPIKYIDNEKEKVNKDMVKGMGESAKYVLQNIAITIINPSAILTNPTIRSVKSFEHVNNESIQYFSTLTESAFSFPFSIKHSNKPCYSFEIKPKWGSLPKNPMIEEEKVHCRYCMQQYQKLASGKFSTHSSYCPLKLFSHNENDQIQAMNALFATGQNNFVFFINGCRRELSSVNQVTMDVPEEEVKHCLPASLLSSSLSLNEMIFSYLLLNTLNSSHVLEDLLVVQNQSEMNDEMAFETYNNYLNQPTPDRKKWIDDYLISRGARDCSILISILQVSDVEDCQQFPSCFSFSIISFLYLILISVLNE